MKINSNGDAERNYSLFGLCQRTVGRPSVGSQWVQSNAIKSFDKNVTYGLCPVGSFGQSSSVAAILLTDDIVWSDGSVPRSTPRCGFRGELCTKGVGYSLHSGEIALATTGLLVLISVIFIVGYRSYKYEKVCTTSSNASYVRTKCKQFMYFFQDLDSMTWKIDPDDLIFCDHGCLFEEKVR